MRRLAAFACPLLLLAATCSSDDGSGTGDAGSGTTVAAPDTAAEAPATDAPTTTAEATTTTEPAPQYAASIDDLLAIGRPIVLAHTGGEDEFPASTMFGFGESVKAGVDMLDLNVQLTKDGVLVVHHDDSVDRATNGAGAVADLTYADIALLDDAYWFTVDCGACNDQPTEDYLYRGMRTGEVPPPAGYSPDDFKIPTFRELVERYPDLPLNVEIKGSGAAARAAADVLAAELVELGRDSAAVVASFDDEIVSYFHSIAPDIEVSPGLDVLTAYVLNSTPVPDGMRILQLPPEYSGLQVITPELVERATADGLPIWVWPNDRGLENYDQYLAFLQQGVEGLNINFPAQGVAAVHDFITPGALVAAAPSNGCDAPAEAPGEATYAMSVHLEGTYIRHLPPSYDGVTPMPMLLGLHGWSQPASVFMTEADLAGAADRHRFIAIAPDITRPVPLWDTSFEGDDVLWFGALVVMLEDQLCIDTSRIYVTGMSNGAMMTSTLACMLPSVFAAAAPVAGVRSPDGCEPDRDVPLIAFHGTDDPFLAFEGGYGPKVAGLPSPDGTGTLGEVGVADPADALPVVDRVAEWAARNGCDGELTESVVADDVTLLSSCDGGATELYVIDGGGHSWPGSEFDEGIVDIVGPTTDSIDATELIWAFFREHPRSA
ncbi:MAG: glycerophosphodiester phosphodiesterase family protein [Ilumatobacteraceae bacterium]